MTYDPYIGVGSSAIRGDIPGTIPVPSGTWGDPYPWTPPVPGSVKEDDRTTPKPIIELKPKSAANPATELIWKTLKESECDTLERWEKLVMDGVSAGMSINEVAETLKKDFAKEMGDLGWDSLSSFLLNGMYEMCQFDIIAWRIRDDWGGRPMKIASEWLDKEPGTITPEQVAAHIKATMIDDDNAVPVITVPGPGHVQRRTFADLEIVKKQMEKDPRFTCIVIHVDSQARTYRIEAQNPLRFLDYATHTIEEGDIIPELEPDPDPGEPEPP